ncbi:11513_t:CDS:2, partial [Dentiscutata heterogama]
GSEYFEKLAQEQKPKSLWICCSDSRVSPELITQSDLGEIVILRNVANQFKKKDLSALSALEYAVEKLDIKHIFVCGHYGCGGINHLIDPVYNTDESRGYIVRTHINKWLSKFIDETYVPNRPEFSKLFDEILEEYKDSTVDVRRDLYIRRKKDKLVELNVKKQVDNISMAAVVQKKWKEGIEVVIHGLVYDLKTGKLKDLNCDHDINCLKRPWIEIKWNQTINNLVAYTIIGIYAYMMYSVLTVEVVDREFRIFVRVPTIGQLLWGEEYKSQFPQPSATFVQCANWASYFCGYFY